MSVVVFCCKPQDQFATTLRVTLLQLDSFRSLKCIIFVSYIILPFALPIPSAGMHLRIGLSTSTFNYCHFKFFSSQDGSYHRMSSRLDVSDSLDQIDNPSILGKHTKVLMVQYIHVSFCLYCAQSFAIDQMNYDFFFFSIQRTKNIRCEIFYTNIIVSTTINTRLKNLQCIFVFGSIVLSVAVGRPQE